MKLLDGEGVRVLIDVVREGCDDGKAAAAKLLARLGHKDPAAQASIATCGAINALVEASKGENPTMRMNAVKALRELTADNPDNEKLVEETGGSPFLKFGVSGGMKFSELSEEDNKRLKEVQARVDAMNEEMKEGEAPKAEEKAEKPSEPLLAAQDI